MIEKLCIWLAWKMPRRLAYYTAVRVVTWASTQGLANKEMGTITAVEALGEWKP